MMKKIRLLSLVLLLFLPLICSAQESNKLIVTGTVIDDSKTAVVGAVVKLKGQEVYTTTNINGEFSVKVNNLSTDILEFGYLGLMSQEVKIDNRSVVNIVMIADAIEVEDIVVIGYGSQKKVSLTSAVTSVDAETLQKTKVGDVRKILQGQVAGLTIVDRGGAPGANNMEMRIRGITSINNNEPLVIVDGVEMQTVSGNNGLGALNPDNIKSISVLKDASSTAIYGSRAANGVILVTTKTPDTGKISVSYNGYFSLTRQNNKFEHMEVGRYMEMQNWAFKNIGSDEPYKPEYITQYVNATDRIKYPLPNVWQDHVYRNAPTWNHSLEMSGGTDNIQTRLSFRYKNEDGVVIKTGLKQYDLQSYTKLNVSKNIDFTANIQYRQMERYSPRSLTGWGGVIYRSFQDCQWAVPIYPDGTFGLSKNGQSPLVVANLAGNTTTSEKDMLGIFKANYEVINGLNLSAQIAPNYSFNDAKSYNYQYKVYSYEDKDKVIAQNNYNDMVINNQSFFRYTLDLNVNYKANFKDSHNLNTIVGYQQIYHNYKSLQGQRSSFYNNQIEDLSQGANDERQKAYGGLSDYALQSLFARVNYDYKNKYLFEANIRYDGSSRFSKNNRFGVFPSFSGGYRMSEENYWNSIKPIISDFKIRGSWGQVGNQQVGLYTFIPTYNQTTVILGEQANSGYAPTTAVSDNLSWETTTQTNIGFDIGFLDNKITLSVDYFVKRTKDILLTLPIPSVMGLLPTAQNAGIMDNRGWEVLLGVKHRINNFNVNFNATAAFIKNEIVDLANTGPYLEGTYIQKEGFAYNTYRGFLTEGVFQTEDEVKKAPVRWSNTAPGDLKYIDVNDDDVINDNDKVELGSNTPKVSYSGNIDLSYKNFSLSMMFQGVAGNKVALEGAIVEMGNWNGFTHKIFTDNYWTPNNRDAYFPRPYKWSTRNTDLYDKLVVNGDYFRLKNIKLSYDIPTDIMAKIGFRGHSSIYFSMTNIFTISKLYRDYDLDPESHFRAAEYNYPQVSTTTIGLNLTF